MAGRRKGERRRKEEERRKKGIKKLLLQILGHFSNNYTVNCFKTVQLIVRNHIINCWKCTYIGGIFSIEFEDR